MNKGIVTIIAVFFILLFAGCVRDELSDSRDYVREVLSRPAKPIPPIQKVRTYEAFVYSSMDLRSPFEPPKLLTRQGSGTEDGFRPDTNRVREPLESFPLDSLKMVGSLKRGDTRFAIIKDSAGVIYRVQVGNYLGQNFGSIESISENEIKITEIVTDGSNGWRKRDATIVLGE
jgi:type IV pilus assembly protein PilP